ncbi:MAG: CopD family protein [Anaerolineales bacterium]|nr:CopD family protein [Anaerolineales bacterium]NUQ85915.1 CopD family protein [Anaerolineales bacterium]
MTQILIALSAWIHATATVVFVGHYLLLAVIHLPALSKNANGPALSAISKRSRGWLYVSMIALLVTGTYLTLMDAGYLGFMNFGNLWGILMLVKHFLILAMIALGFWHNAILRVGPMMNSNNPEGAIARFRKHVNVMTVCGALVLLLTAAAQME